MSLFPFECSLKIPSLFNDKFWHRQRRKSQFTEYHFKNSSWIYHEEIPFGFNFFTISQGRHSIKKSKGITKKLYLRLKMSDSLSFNLNVIEFARSYLLSYLTLIMSADKKRNLWHKNASFYCSWSKK